ncbi:MAG: hypothetical protein GY797_38320 [Deltaproteobacteria bacterium]|nr:hypothetical protein [Deltaproteobacteria bacterium]
MKNSMFLTFLCAIFVLIGQNAFAQSLDGSYGSSPRWGSSWLELRQPTTFESGTCLHFVISDGASKILIRFLRVDDDPNQPVGLYDGIHEVPESREIVVMLSRQFANIKQISIHGNPKAWHYDLGGNNGPAILETITIVACQNQ